VNKVVAVIGVILLVLCGANTFFLYTLVSALKTAGEKIQSASKELEKVQPVLKEVKDKLANMGPGKPPPIGPGDPKDKLDGNGADNIAPDPKVPPGKPPLPPGPLPKSKE
jgi:hypothetical protein